MWPILLKGKNKPQGGRNLPYKNLSREESASEYLLSAFPSGNFEVI